jgi:hypothetical protein
VSRLSPGQIDALSKLPSLQGAPLSIFVALLIAQQPLQATEMQTFTGLANEAVTKGLKKLTDLRAVIHLGRFVGWTLTPDWRQLPLPLQFLAEENHENRDHHENRDFLISSSRYIASGKESLTTTTYQTAIEIHENRDFPQSEVRPETTVPVEPENTALNDPEDIEVAHWLLHGGIAPGSPKMTALLKLELAAEYVQAHVLEHLYELKAWERERVGRKPGTGTLIYRLENDWPAPVMRCETCLERLPCICHLVKR